MERSTSMGKGDSKEGRRLTKTIPGLITVAALLVVPLILPSYYLSVATTILIFGLFAMSLNIIFGHTGLNSLGHAAFFGTAGYVTGIAIVTFGITSFWTSAPLGILGAAITAAVFGVIALRVSGVYFLLVTFALGQLLWTVAEKWYSVTMGRSGFVGIPAPDLGLPFLDLGSPVSFYYFVFAFFVICYYLMARLHRSPFGYALQGIRERESRMRALGYNVWLYKYIAYIIAAVFAGIGGILYGHFNGSIAPSHVGFSTSALVMLMVILGGAGTLWGPVLGAALIILIQSFASLVVPARWPLILGVLFVIGVMGFRGGVGPHVAKTVRRMFSSGSDKG
jgi:branched-chain amino acid transport system permease protein